MRIKTMIAVLMIAVAFSSCKKEPIKGDKGEDGKDGNANVTSMNLVATSWTWDNTNKWRYALWNNVSILTSDVASGGAVMLYQNDGAGSYIALPATINLTSTVQEHDFFAYSTNVVTVYIENSDLSDPNPSSLTYKLVCIPKAMRLANPNVDMTDFKEVKAKYHIE